MIHKEERGVGKEGASMCRSRRSPKHLKKIKGRDEAHKKAKENIRLDRALMLSLGQ